QLHFMACSLRAIGKIITEDDLVTQVLQGLPSSYRTFVSGLNASGNLPLFIFLRPLLLTEEAHIKNTPIEDSCSQTTALVATTQGQPNSGNQFNRGQQHGRGRGKNGRHPNGRGRGNPSRSFSPQWNAFRPPSHIFQPSHGILGHSPFTPNPAKQCQICFHYNHTALECKNRFNHSYVSNSIPKSIAAMSHEEVQPTVWYPDSGASAHMTSDASLLSSSSPYT
ncbi:hypothetical protein A4A49_59463, partial [Nicotiana attenuata]